MLLSFFYANFPPERIVSLVMQGMPSAEKLAYVSATEPPASMLRSRNSSSETFAAKYAPYAPAREAVRIE
jgi:hypothetical protein